MHAHKYIMKTDDDAFVRIDEVVSSLKKSNSHGLLYGLISFQSSPHRDKDSKWFISRKVFPAAFVMQEDFIWLVAFSHSWEMQEWPFDMYPPWAHGPGYIISRDIAKFVVLGHQELTLQVGNDQRISYFVILVHIGAGLDWSCCCLSYSNSKMWQWGFGSNSTRAVVNK